MAAEDEKEVRAQLLRYIGEALRADMRGATNAPPSRPIMLQLLHLIRREQERRGLDAVRWEELPEDLRRLLEQLPLGHDPGPSDV
jgi:hypothetical protein